ncbi:MAG TPA: 4-hydroxy-tetrahydrodipicolinate synthase [Candidatus Acidoferrum sp.]|jgi:4-hydroxy-2-oxoglutarate aldolase|nr:4-hydroxy-tetrahydrodipicolinate synthase [Candidatus Acidoferrum sp.]
MDLSGIYPALTTPFGTDGSVSLSGLKHNIQQYNQTGVSGYVAIGSTGESVLLTSAEVEAVLATVKESAAKGKTLIAGTGAESTAETILRTKRAAVLGYDVALVKTPYYYKPSYKPEVLIAHYRRVADESPIPVMLYSVPQFTGIALEPPEIAALAEHPNIIGIKDSSGNVQRVGETIAIVPSAFQVLVGSASTVYPSLTIGSRGAILALASALPEKCVALFELVRQGPHERARELQSLLARASKLMVSEGGIAGVKYAMDQRGYHGGLPRLPLLPLHDEQKKRLSELMATFEPAAMSA